MRIMSWLPTKDRLTVHPFLSSEWGNGLIGPLSVQLAVEIVWVFRVSRHMFEITEGNSPSID